MQLFIMTYTLVSIDTGSVGVMTIRSPGSSAVVPDPKEHPMPTMKKPEFKMPDIKMPDIKIPEINADVTKAAKDIAAVA